MLESTGAVKSLRLRIADDVDRGGAEPPGLDHAVLDQLATDPPAPGPRLDEEGVQFQVAVFARDQGRESLDRAGGLSDEDLQGVDLRLREIDGIGMREDRLPVRRIGQGGAPLQRLERGPFVGTGGPDPEGGGQGLMSTPTTSPPIPVSIWMPSLLMR